MTLCQLYDNLSAVQPSVQTYVSCTTLCQLYYPLSVVRPSVSCMTLCQLYDPLSVIKPSVSCITPCQLYDPVSVVSFTTLWHVMGEELRNDHVQSQQIKFVLPSGSDKQKVFAVFLLQYAFLVSRGQCITMHYT